MSNDNLNSGIQATMSDADFAEHLGHLSEKWRRATEHDLEIRHETGALFNQRFKDPTQRQKRGDEVLKKAAEQLQIAQSDISRMRWFAFSFPSIQDMKATHSGVTTWSAVKKLLPTLKAKAKAKEQPRAATPSQKKALRDRKLTKIKQQFEELPSNMREVHSGLTAEELGDLKAKFQVAVQALSECLNLKVKVVVPKKAKKPSPASGVLPVVEVIPEQTIEQSVEEEIPPLVVHQFVEEEEPQHQVIHQTRA